MCFVIKNVHGIIGLLIINFVIALSKVTKMSKLSLKKPSKCDIAKLCLLNGKIIMRPAHSYFGFNAARQLLPCSYAALKPV
jgi:hypothetical protein